MVVGNVPVAVDLVIAGAGPGGYVAAIHAAHAGRKVMLVDAAGDDGVGGVCLRVGCIPSKALIEAAELNERVKHAAQLGINVTGQSFDMALFQIWKASKVAGLTGGVAGLLSAAGVQVKRGRLRVTEPGTAIVTDGDGGAQFLSYKDLILATGSRPTELSVLPIDGTRIIDSTGALALTAVPTSVAVVGGGYIGLELGTALAKLGAQVSIVEAAPRLLPQMDAAIARPVGRRLRELGVTVFTDAQVIGADDQSLLFRQRDEDKVLPCACIVVAVGRTPNLDDIGLEDTGIKRGADGLLQPQPSRIVARHIAAIGDITPGPALAHKASAEAAIAVAALAGAKVAFEPQAIPAVIFSDPEVASVGMTQSQAREAGIDAVKTTIPLTASGRAATLNHRIGFAESISDAADGAILGVHLVGPHASELIAEATLAIEMGVTLEDLALTIHPHPTLSEQMGELAHLALGSPVHARA